jgi:hypothetical protein
MASTKTWKPAARAAAIAGLALAGAPPSIAQDKAPDWALRPSIQQLMGVWPLAAMKSGLGGKAVIRCIVTIQGTLRDCHVISETPPGQGFGGAALTLSPQLLMRPAMKGGVPVEGTASIPIVWEDTRAGSAARLGGPVDGGGIVTRIVSNVGWSQAPSVNDVLTAYPPKARAEKLGGLATLDCALTKVGALHECRVIQEAPIGQGFGAAARQLSAKFVGSTMDASGATLAGAHIQIPFAFSAASLDGGAQVIGKPQWAGLPKAADLLAVYPPEAVRADVLKGRVVMDCTVAADGALADCQVASEDPAGYGLGKATLSLAGTFRLSIWTAEGLPMVGGKVRVPIRYDITQRAPEPARP